MRMLEYYSNSGVVILFTYEFTLKENRGKIDLINIDTWKIKIKKDL